jgi:dethiobiotin synthetase
MRKKVIGITGIGTEIGKTVVSTILVKALSADFWKPIQAGELNNLDSDFVKKFNPQSTIFSERYLLTEPMSPHAAANIDGVLIQLSDFDLPLTKNSLIIEGAGGVMVPLNSHGLLISDLFANLVDEVILVSKHYLGSINHTLLTVQYLLTKGIKIKGILFVGDEHKTTESIIESTTSIKILGRIPWTKSIDQLFIETEAEKLRKTLS